MPAVGSLLKSALLIAILLFVLPIGAANAAKPFCGDNKCTGKETEASCPADCSGGGGDVCGDNECTGDETCSTCSADCGACPPATCNNDGICNAGEDCIGCPNDCPGVTSGKRSDRYCCGADTCDTGKCGASCGTAGPVCGNGKVEAGEECDDGGTEPGDGCDANCQRESSSVPVPFNQFNVGDSIGEGEAAYNSIGNINHQTVWSTGYDGGDIVDSLNERFEATSPEAYYENTAARDLVFNHAISGAVMADFAAQAQNVVDNADATPSGDADMITVLLGNNDICADSIADMTDPTAFENSFRAGLDVLAGSPKTSDAHLLISGLPAVYWLWHSKRGDLICRIIIWPLVPCQNVLSNPSNDCASAASTNNPDVIDQNDGPNCQRRKEVHALTRDTYNEILERVANEYRDSIALPNAAYVDILDVQFNSSHVNDGDCFHPSAAGHALLGQTHWCRSPWSEADPLCSP